MKKALKTSLSVLIAAIIALTPLCAFALQEGDTVNWYGWEFAVKGTLAEGENKKLFETSDNEQCFIFSPEKTGYYIISAPLGNIYCFDYVDESGCFDDEMESLAIRGDAEEFYSAKLFYFDKTEYYVCTDNSKYSSDDCGNIIEYQIYVDINVEYCGETVSQLDFEGGYKYGLIHDYNIDYYGYSSDKGHEYRVDAGETLITFDTGKTAVPERFRFDCFSSQKMENGSYDIEVELLNDSFNKTVSVKPITEEITDIKITNIENYTEVSFGYDECLIYDFSGMELALTYADGHTETVNPKGDGMGIDLLNGNPWYIFLDWYYDCDYSKNEVTLIVCLGNYNYVEVPCTVTEATRKENRQHYYYEVVRIIERCTDNTENEIDNQLWYMETADSMYEKLVYWRRALAIRVNALIEVCENIALETRLYQKGISVFN